MKNILYILLFLVYSCDDLGEQSGPLDYNGLISEGWSNFMQGNYDRSGEFFLNILDIDPSLIFYYSDAYLGLGWSAIYNAKNISGADSTSFSDRFELRQSAKQWFYEAIDEIDSYTGEEPLPDNLISDLYAGLSYTYSSLVLYNELDPYMLNEDTDNLVNSALEYSELVLLSDQNYSFLYDPENINANSLHLLRAQLYLMIEDYEQAEQEITLIESPSIQINFELISEQNDNSFDMFLYAGFEGQDKHLFEMTMLSDSTYTLTRSFTPSYPCLDLINDGLVLQDNEIVECLNSFYSNNLEYQFTIRVPNSINDILDDQSSCELEDLFWIEGVGCVDSWMYIAEEINDGDCLNNGYRNLFINEDDTLTTINACFGSCSDCQN